MTEPIRVPLSVIKGVKGRWPNSGDDWAHTVLGEFEDLCARYQARPVRVLPARFGFVVAVDGHSGRLVMRSTPDPAGQAQAAVLGELARFGVAPRVHEAFTSNVGTWTIMDEVVPGTSLADAESSTVRPAAILDLFRAIIDQPAPAIAGMEDISAWLERRLTKPDLTDLPIEQTVAPDGERQQALTLLAELGATGGTSQLCHGDSYPGNVLIGHDDRVLWIDPRGMAGDVGYDLAVFALKASRHVVPDACAMASYIAEQVGVDMERARSWVIVASAARV